MPQSTLHPPDEAGLSDLRLEAYGQVRLEIPVEGEAPADLDLRQVDRDLTPRVRVGLLQQALQHGRSFARWLVSHALKIVGTSMAINAFALRSLHGPRIRETAALYRALAPRKKLALALGIDESNASRLQSGRTATMLARFCDEMDRLLEAEIDPAPLLAYAGRRVSEKRRAMIARLNPHLRRAS